MTWQAAVAKIEAKLADTSNPGSPYVSLYLSRKQAEALVRKLTKPHLGPLR